MANSVLQYTTREGDRWDLIAYKYYGNAAQIDGLIAANPHLPIAEQFGANLTVFVPVMTAAVRNTQEDMPPWMR